MLLFFVVATNFSAQNSAVDSLKIILKTARQDTNRVNSLIELCLVLGQNNPDTSLIVGNQALTLAQKLNYKKGEAWAECRIGRAHIIKQDYEEAMQHYNKALSLSDALLKSNSQPDVRSAIRLRGVIFSNIAHVYREQKADYPRALEYYLKGLKLSEEAGDKQMVDKTIGNIAAVYIIKCDYQNARKYLFKRLKACEQNRDKQRIHGILNSIAHTYNEQADFSRGLKYLYKAQKAAEEVGDKTALCVIYSNIGSVNLDLGNFSKGLEYFFQGLKFSEEVGDKRSVGIILSNIGAVYEQQSDYPKALEWYLKGQKISLEAGDKQQVGISLSCLGSLYKQQADYPKAIEFYLKGLKISEEVGYKLQVGKILIGLGDLYTITGKYKEAEQNLKRGLSILKEIGAANEEKLTHERLSALYEKSNCHDLALKHYKIFIALRDTIFSKENTKKVIRTEMNNEYEKAKLVADAEYRKEIEKQNAVADERHRKQIIITYSVGSGLILVLILAILIFRSYRQKQKANHIITLQKREVEDQKQLIEEKHREITDSINYAERIQRSLLASKDLLDKNLKEHFVFFQPKDVVSGDFYWASKLSNNQFALITADSTGHGVPGAIMSILNIACLNETIKEGVCLPNEILNNTRTKIIDVLKRDGSKEGGKDGMDCSLISFDTENKKIVYAAANNPVWIVRNKELIELHPDKMPVGKHDFDSKPFTLHFFDLQRGDCIYTLTDGIADQFGGPKGKKFMYKRLKELLISVAPLTMQEQKEKLADSFKSWKGNLEQVDDVCVIGVRV